MRPRARLALNHHYSAISSVPIVTSWRHVKLCVSKVRGKAMIGYCSSTSTSENLRNGTGGTWMNQQDMQDRRVRRRTDYPAPVQTPHDAEEDEYDDVYPPRMPTSARRYTSTPAQHPRKRVINVYDDGTWHPTTSKQIDNPKLCRPCTSTRTASTTPTI